ncbi:MAG: efflux RND transporter periplasmic adaptor subunit [Chryseobacterium sp.]|uniref:efflux RND transporter periplasmic adaptor subunit n=1 Tax=Chryseobacterium arthrosphaerae TaxID=651561 RepID=UPI001BAFD3C9|nr:efflux RND transporter periplasmic adaptor subunit [Chryseobacterium arthrosphaerae]MDN5396732.1 efflux RND transporter periplasmic adaptor subunit [Chryseobacterium sp.]MDN5478428.1 efflux RND transporter periplasmic adaptor subunit [Chryseobacterium sp.]QUY56442.1 efflux RND transporter periplasmic adaptor subunit [Chryseobacterium arthrosphaerae]
MKQHIIYTAFAFVFLINCGKKEAAKESESEVKTEERGEETPQTIASLTEEQMKAVGITFGKIEMKELTSTIKANGALRVPNNNKATITSMYGGIIKTLNVQIGDFVRKGQVIASISNPEYIQLQEQYLTVKSRIAFAEQEYRRQKELFDNDAGAKKNLQSSDAELKTLRTQLSSLQRQLQIMGINPANINNGNLRSGLVITSPISGTVSNISSQIGSYVDISSPVAEIIDNGSLHLDLQIFEKDLPKMKVGQIVHFKLTNNPETEYDAKIYSIGSSFENDSKTISVHCSVTGNKSGLIDGMNITGIVSLDKSTTPAVPNEAIVEADSKYFIFMKTEKKAEEHHEEEEGEHLNEKKIPEKEEKMTNFEKIEVVKGSSDMGYTAITTVNEISANAEVVIKGAFFVNAKLSNSGEHEH